MFLADEDKTAKFGECSGMQINSCSHASFETLLACDYSRLSFAPAPLRAKREDGKVTQTKKYLMLNVICLLV